MNIILIGFMGSGKSVVGHLLAQALKMDYLDTDELVARTEKRTISQIFQKEGEAYFRKIENEVLKTLQNYDNFVLSTGGGMVLLEENVALLKSMGSLVLLWAEPAAIYERLKAKRDRPLLQVPDPQAEMVKILDQRSPVYNKAADHKIDTTKISPQQAVEEIIKWLRSK